MLDPKAGVAEQPADLLLDHPVLDADVARRLPVGACPAPDVAEHPLVEPSQEPFLEDRLRVSSAAERPPNRLRDALLLDDVELAAGGDRRAEDLRYFIGVERRLTVGCACPTWRRASS